MEDVMRMWTLEVFRRYIELHGAEVLAADMSVAGSSQIIRMAQKANLLSGNQVYSYVESSYWYGAFRATS